MSTPLNRAALGLPTPPVRLVHLGLGAFHRAHQAWYTQHAETDPGRPEWGYASFTGRSAALADQLAPQDGLYTLVERSGDGVLTALGADVAQQSAGGRAGRLGGLAGHQDGAHRRRPGESGRPDDAAGTPEEGRAATLAVATLFTGRVSARLGVGMSVLPRPG